MAGLWIVGKLNIGSTNHLNSLNNVIGISLQTFLKFRADRQHGGRTETVAGMDSHGVDIFDKANRYHLVFSISNHFQFEFLPTQDRFFNQDLIDKTRRQTAGGDNS